MGVLSKGKNLFRRSTGGEKVPGSRDGSGDEFEDATDVSGSLVDLLAEKRKILETKGYIPGALAPARA